MTKLISNEEISPIELTKRCYHSMNELAKKLGLQEDPEVVKNLKKNSSFFSI